MPERVLVTGAAGFVGSHLVDHLVRGGWQVTGMLHRTAPRLTPPFARHVEWVHADVCEPETLRGLLRRIDVVFHVGGAVRGPDGEHFDRVNRCGTEALLDAVEAEGRGVRRFVYISSLAACGPPTPRQPATEGDPPHPTDMYGRSKLGGEQACLARRDRIPVTIVRPPAVMGPRDRGFYQLFRLVRSHLCWTLPGPNRRYSWVYVADLVRGVVAAATSPRAIGEIFYVTAPGAVGWGELQDEIARILDVWVLHLRIPYPMLFAYALGGEIVGRISGHPPLVYRDKARQARAPCWTCDGGKAERVLGFKAAIGLDVAIADTAAWYREEGWL